MVTRSHFPVAATRTLSARLNLFRYLPDLMETRKCLEELISVPRIDRHPRDSRDEGAIIFYDPQTFQRWFAHPERLLNISDENFVEKGPAWYHLICSTCRLHPEPAVRDLPNEDAVSVVKEADEMLWSVLLGATQGSATSALILTYQNPPSGRAALFALRDKIWPLAQHDSTPLEEDCRSYSFPQHLIPSAGSAQLTLLQRSLSAADPNYTISAQLRDQLHALSRSGYKDLVEIYSPSTFTEGQLQLLLIKADALHFQRKQQPEPELLDPETSTPRPANKNATVLPKLLYMLLCAASSNGRARWKGDSPPASFNDKTSVHSQPVSATFSDSVLDSASNNSSDTVLDSASVCVAPSVPLAEGQHPKNYADDKILDCSSSILDSTSHFSADTTDTTTNQTACTNCGNSNHTASDCKVSQLKIDTYQLTGIPAHKQHKKRFQAVISAAQQAHSTALSRNCTTAPSTAIAGAVRGTPRAFQSRTTSAKIASRSFNPSTTLQLCNSATLQPSNSTARLSSQTQSRLPLISDTVPASSALYADPAPLRDADTARTSTSRTSDSLDLDTQTDSSSLEGGLGSTHGLHTAWTPTLASTEDSSSALATAPLNGVTALPTSGTSTANIETTLRHRILKPKGKRPKSTERRIWVPPQMELQQELDSLSVNSSDTPVCAEAAFYASQSVRDEHSPVPFPGNLPAGLHIRHIC